MTFRSVDGLMLRVRSPSLYELCAFDDGSPISLVCLSYIPRAWYIDILMKRGESHHRGPYPSREAAVAAMKGHAA